LRKKNCRNSIGRTVKKFDWLKKEVELNGVKVKLVVSLKIRGKFNLGRSRIFRKKLYRA